MTPSEQDLSLHLVPRTCGTPDMGELELTGEEGYILTSIDGVTRIGGLCQLSVLAEDKTLAALQSLADKKIIVFYDPDAGPSAEAYEVPEEKAPDQAPGPAPVAGGKTYTLLELKTILRKPLPKGEELASIVGATFVNLEYLSYYDLLGINGQAAAGQIKKAYLIRTKSFHPDRFFRSDDPELRDRVQEVFKQLNKGYKVISDPDKKAEYDEVLGEDELQDMQEETVVAGPVGRTRTVKGESPWKRIQVSRHQPVEEKVRKRRPAPQDKKPSGPKLKLGIKDGASPSPLLQRIHEIKKQQQESNPNLEQAERLYKGAMVELGRQNYDAAEINLKLAIQYAPLNPKYKQAMEQIRRHEQQDRADAAYRSGLDAHRIKDFKSSARFLREAMKLGIDNAKLYHMLAEAVIDLENNYDLARTLVLKAMEKEPNVADYHATMARVFKGLGQKGAAVQQLEKVLKLEPKNKLIAKELKALKRS